MTPNAILMELEHRYVCTRNTVSMDYNKLANLMLKYCDMV